MEKMIYIGSYTGIGQNSNKPYYVLYLGAELRDKNGNPVGDGYRPKTFFVDKEEFNDFQACGVGTVILAKYQTEYNKEKGTERNILKRYEI